MKNSNIIIKIIIPLILAIFFFLIASFSIQDKTITTDEDCHMVRGIMLLETGDYRLNQHHPILANVLHAIPAVFNPDLETPDLESEKWQEAKKDAIAWNLVDINGGHIDFSQNILYNSRLVNIVMSSIFLFIFYHVILKLFGTIPAISASTLMTLSPTFIAHSSLVTTDTPVTIFIFLSSIPVVFFIKYYKNIKHRNIALGLFILLSFLALITKYTALIPFLICTLVILIYSFVRERNLKYPTILLLIILLSTFLLSFASYGFRTDTLKASAYEHQPTIQDDYNHIGYLPTEPLNIQGFVKNTYENVPLPMPEYIRGFYENVFKHNLYGHTTYFIGDFSADGHILYFPTAFLIKEPIPIVILTITSLFLSAIYLCRYRKIKPEYLVLILVPITLTVFSLKSDLNLGIRHILPIYPFIFLLVGITIQWIYNNHRILFNYAIIPLIALTLLSVLQAFPHYIEYFNEFIGDKQNAYKYLRDSNLDWGQNRYLVQRYTEENPEEDYKIIRVESMFQNPAHISKEMQDFQDRYHEGDLEVLDYISNTHWVIEKD